MLWLAGLMGIVGVGAASLVISQPEEEIEEEDVEDPEIGFGNGDMLNDFEGLDQFAFDDIDLDDFDAVDTPSSETLAQNNAEVHGSGITDSSEANANSAAAIGAEIEKQLYEEMHSGQFADTNDVYDFDDDQTTVDPEFAESDAPRDFGVNPLSGILGKSLFDDPADNSLADSSDVPDVEGLLEDDKAGLLVLDSKDMIVEPEDAAQQMLGDWVLEGTPAEPLQYEAAQDSLMLVWDDLAEDAKEPEVDVTSDPKNEEVMHVLMNGKSVAEVHGDPNLEVSDLTVIPLSSALIVGLEPA